MSSYPMAHKCALVVMVGPPLSVACCRSGYVEGWIVSVVQLPRVVCPDQFAACCFAREQVLLAVEVDLADVWPKQQRKGPVDHDARPPAPARHLQQVVGASDDPCEDPAYPHP